MQAPRQRPGTWKGANLDAGDTARGQGPHAGHQLRYHNIEQAKRNSGVGDEGSRGNEDLLPEFDRGTALCKFTASRIFFSPLS